MLRVAVYDDDRELLGQRSLPVNAIRAGYRQIPLRDKYNQPLSLASLFVHIMVDDWVGSDMEGQLLALLVINMLYICDYGLLSVNMKREGKWSN